MTDDFFEEKESNKGKIVKAVVYTYIIVFLATLGFTGVIDYGKIVKPAMKVASRIYPKKDTKKTEKKELQPTQQLPLQPIQTPPVTLPSSASQPTQSAGQDNETAKVTEANASELARVYSNMDSDKAAAIFKNLTDEEIILLIKTMQKPAASDIFAEMNSSRVARITSKMMNPTSSAEVSPQKGAQ